MKMLITGGSGKLGKALTKQFPEALHPARPELNLVDKKSVFGCISKHKPDIIIHAGGIAGIKECEDRQLAYETNVRGTERLVEACLEYIPDVHFVYISTAGVFDGVNGNYDEDSVPDPKNFYSLTKLLGEFITKRMKTYTIARTNFVAYEKWPHQRAFTDRFGTYLFAEGVAKGIDDVIRQKIRGIVHVCGNKKISMFDLAKITTPDIKPITLKEYSGPPLTVDMSLVTKRFRPYDLMTGINGKK